jgi:hypothetical protein
LRDLIALYASGDVDEKQRARVEAHLARCPQCRRAAAEMRSLTAAASAQRVEPPADLAARIADRVSRQPTLAPPQAPFRWSLAFGFAGALAVVFAAGVLVGFQLPGSKVQSYVAAVAKPPPNEPSSASARVAAGPHIAARPEQPAGNAREPVAATSSLPSEPPAAPSPPNVIQPPPLRAPVPAQADDVRLASLPPPAGAAETAAVVSRAGATPSRGRWIRSCLVRGRVTYNHVGVRGIHLRLVTADGAFVPGAGATTGPDGEYEFRGVAPGTYQVYAYVGDNPRYFNRHTGTARVAGKTATMSDLQLGIVLEALEPRLGAVVEAGDAVELRWSDCPGAAEYSVTVADEETGVEAFSTRVTQPLAAVPASSLSRGRTYRWQVRATASDGAFLGGSPGVGGEPWSFRVR